METEVCYSVYTTVSTCPVTIVSTMENGSTSFVVSSTVSTQTLTITSTAPCHACGPNRATVTLSVLSLPPSYLPSSASMAPTPSVPYVPSLPATPSAQSASSAPPAPPAPYVPVSSNTSPGGNIQSVTPYPVIPSVPGGQPQTSPASVTSSVPIYTVPSSPAINTISVTTMPSQPASSGPEIHTLSVVTVPSQPAYGSSVVASVPSQPAYGPSVVASVPATKVEQSTTPINTLATPPSYLSVSSVPTQVTVSPSTGIYASPANATLSSQAVPYGTAPVPVVTLVSSVVPSNIATPVVSSSSVPVTTSAPVTSTPPYKYTGGADRGLRAVKAGYLGLLAAVVVGLAML
jgi:hypothetical protein